MDDQAPIPQDIAPTPELIPAPLSKRFLAYCVDLGIISAILYPLLIVGLIGVCGLALLLTGGRAELMNVLMLPSTRIAAALILFGFAFATLMLYHAYFIFHELRQGTTPGKKLFGLKVISLQNGNLTFKQCAVRDVFRYLDCVLLIPGIVSMGRSATHQRLGDKVARTWVVYSKHQEAGQELLYLQQREFDYLRSALPARDISPELRTRFLKFAYPTLIGAPRDLTVSELSEWTSVILQFIPNAESSRLTSRGLLLYFAELCFQAEKETSQ